MLAIPIVSKCEAARNYLKEWDLIPSYPPAYLFSNDGYPNDGTDKGTSAVIHVQNCDKCKDWLESLVSESDIARMSRMKKYCCQVMFGAVEEPQEDQVKIRFVQFKEDMTWQVTGFSSLGGNQLISYCPWCGKKLPEEPFVGIGANDG